MHEFFNRLQTVMMTVFTCLTVERNPVSTSRDMLKVGYALLQYTLFPKAIVSMLGMARKVAEREGWAEVAAELARNIGQEKGSDSQGVPHYNILALAVEREFGLDPWEVVPEPATDRFLRSVWQALRQSDPLAVMGAVYALECTAVPELTVVLSLVEHLASRRGDATLHPDTVRFFERHMGKWEPSHEEGLRVAAGAILYGEAEEKRFEEGFVCILRAMETWWLELADEAAS